MSTDLNLRLSAHFKAGEFQCHDGSALPDDFATSINDTVEFLERLRFLMNWHVMEKYDKGWQDIGVVVTSGHRTVEYQEKKKISSPTSRHVTGEAADVRPVSGYGLFTYADFWKMAELVDMSFPGKAYRLGQYSNIGLGAWVHVDCAYGHGGLRWGS